MKHARTTTYLPWTAAEAVFESNPGNAQLRDRFRAYIVEEIAAHWPNYEGLQVSMPPLRHLDPNANGHVHMP
jgi:hypothetical protein